MQRLTHEEEHIRPVDIEDVQAVSQLYMLLGRHQPVDLDELSRFLEVPTQYMALYIDGEELPIGLVAWTTWPASLSFPQPICFIQDLVVLPAFRRRGIATALLKHVHQWGETHAIHVFHLQASVQKLGVQELYVNNGYEAKNYGFYKSDRV